MKSLLLLFSLLGTIGSVIALMMGDISAATYILLLAIISFLWGSL